MNVKTSEAIEHFKTPEKTGRNMLAEVLTKEGWPVSPEAISQWGDFPPLGRQYQIQALTNGQLMAETETKKTG